ncbi:hypothetical protein OC844_000782 [Tilletia horrida]|nr:hypothetical protein OC844_000782 [Tilletia horrida]
MSHRPASTPSSASRSQPEEETHHLEAQANTADPAQHGDRDEQPLSHHDAATTAAATALPPAPSDPYAPQPSTDARDLINEAVTAPTPDDEWPPTLEQWHLAKEQGHAGPRASRPAEPISSGPIKGKGVAITPSGSAAPDPSSLSTSLQDTSAMLLERSTAGDALLPNRLQRPPAKIQQLPQEVLMRLFAFLDPFDLVSAALVCRSWAKVALDDTTWRGAFAVYFGLDWGADDRRALLNVSLAAAGGDGDGGALAGLDLGDSNAVLKARSVALRRLRPVKWKQEFIARWELVRRWRKTKTQPISTNPSISTISQLAYAPPTPSHSSSFLLSASLAYGVACRSDPFTGRRISMGFLDASGNTNGAGIGNPNAEFSPDVTSLAMSADARSIVWGFRTGHVSLTLLSKQGTNPRGLVRSIRFDEQSRHRGAVVDIALPLAAGSEGGARSVVRSPARLAQHLSEMGDVAATFVSAGADGTVRLWAWPLEKSHGGVGSSAGGGGGATLGGTGHPAAQFRKHPLWKGSVLDGLSPLAPGERRLPPSLSKVAFHPALGIVVAGTTDGNVIVWSNIDVARLVTAPTAAFAGAGGTVPAAGDWHEQLQQIFGAVRVNRIAVQPSRGEAEHKRVAAVEIAAPSIRRVGDKADEVSILVHLEDDSVLRRFDLAFGPGNASAAAVGSGTNQPWDRDEFPKVKAYVYGLASLKTPITAFRADFDTLSSNDRARADHAAASASASPATRSPTLLPTVPSRRNNMGRISSGNGSALRAERDPVRFSLPISAAYSEGVKLGDRGLYSERAFLVAGTESGHILIWDWEMDGVKTTPELSREHSQRPKVEKARDFLRVSQSSFVNPCMAFAAHTAAVSAIDLSPLAIVIGTVDGSIKVFNSLNGALIRVFNDKAASRHPARMLAEGQLTEEQAAQFCVRQLIVGEESLVAAIGPHVVAWRTEAVAGGGGGGGGKGKGHSVGIAAAKKAGPKARSQRVASWQTKYQANAELQADVKESAALLKRENRDRQASYERMRWATGPPELGGLDDEEALEYAIMLSREDAGRRRPRHEDGDASAYLVEGGTADLGIGSSSGVGAGAAAAADFDLDAALAQFDEDDHVRSRGVREGSPLNSDDSGDASAAAGGGAQNDRGSTMGTRSSSTAPSPLSSPQLRGISTPSRAWEILSNAGNSTHSITPDRWGAASKVRTVSVPRSARMASAANHGPPPSVPLPASLSSSASSPPPSPLPASWQRQQQQQQQQRLSAGDDAAAQAQAQAQTRTLQAGVEEWPSVSPPSFSTSLGSPGRSPGLGAWSFGSSQAVRSAGVAAPAGSGSGGAGQALAGFGDRAAVPTSTPSRASYGSIAASASASGSASASASASPRARAATHGSPSPHLRAYGGGGGALHVAGEGSDAELMDDDLRFALELSMAEEQSRRLAMREG